MNVRERLASDQRKLRHRVAALEAQEVTVIGSGTTVPVTNAQNQMIISNATPAWSLLAAPTAQGQVPITGADPYTPVWGTTFPTVIQFDAGLTLGGATGVNVITVPDNLAQAAHLVDAGGIEYLRVVSTDAQPALVFNEGGADIDHRWEASGQPNAMFMQGSTGYVALGHDGPERAWHMAGGHNYTAIIFQECYDGPSPGDFFFRKGRGTVASPTDVAVDDYLGSVAFLGYRNADWRKAASIGVDVEALGTSTVRGGIIFSTTDGNDVFAERVRITRSGAVRVRSTTGDAMILLDCAADTGDARLYWKEGEANRWGLHYYSPNNYLRLYNYVTGHVIVDFKDDDDIVLVPVAGRVSVGAGAPAGKVHVDQSANDAAIPVLVLDQADVSEEFINFISAVGEGDPIDTVSASGLAYAIARIAVNGTFKYLKLYDGPA